MSVIVASGEAISKSPINTSKSKMMYSFSKSTRFPKIDRRGYADALYLLPEIKSKRSTTFGLGNKYDFTKSQKGMNTQFYSNGSDFDKEHPHSPCFSFGVGRDKYSTVYYETNKMIAATKELFVALKAQKKLCTDDIDMTAVSFAMTIHSIMDYRFDFLCSKETIPQDDIMQNYIKWFCGQFGGNENEKNVD